MSGLPPGQRHSGDADYVDRAAIDPKDDSLAVHHPIYQAAHQQKRRMTPHEQLQYWSDLGWYRRDDGMLCSLTDGHESPLQPPERFLPPLPDGSRPIATAPAGTQFTLNQVDADPEPPPPRAYNEPAKTKPHVPSIEEFARN